jgi:hypothetical protein
MSFYIDVKYLKMISCKLEGFTQKNNDLYTCRCPYCGDSQKKKSKKRGFLFRKNNDMFFHCHNCGKGATFYKFLNFVDPILAKEYSFERYSNGETGHHNYTKPKFEFTKPVFNTKEKLNIPSVKSLSSDDLARKYVENRKIPESYFSDLYYAEDFKAFLDDFFPDHGKDLFSNDKRLVIPFRNKFNKIVALQGRTLANSSIRYITIKIDENFDKIYGLNRTDLNKHVYVCEGPIDSMFIDNCIATADANLSSAKGVIENKNNMTLIFDNEPRNLSLIKRIEKAIDQNFKVCLFPETFEFKDINDAILSGMTSEEIIDIINKNTFSELRAKLEIITWRKC